jgi:hypothetical protein
MTKPVSQSGLAFEQATGRPAGHVCPNCGKTKRGCKCRPSEIACAASAANRKPASTGIITTLVTALRVIATGKTDDPQGVARTALDKWENT